MSAKEGNRNRPVQEESSLTPSPNAEPSVRTLLGRMNIPAERIANRDEYVDEP